ncbi:hypothetical protein CR513_27913, partial [Mucuna pruriens]
TRLSPGFLAFQGKNASDDSQRLSRFQLSYGRDHFDPFRTTSPCGNLISISSLDKFSFSYSSRNNKVSLYQNSNVVGSSLLIDNLYMLDVVSSYNEILHTSSCSTKQKLNENSIKLGLVLDEVLKPLDSLNFEVCVECIKGKQTNIRKLGTRKS